MLFAGCMTQALVYDEDQHVAAGVLARTLWPYRDFVYLQPPLYPQVLAAVFALADGYYLLSARLLTFVLSLAASLLLYRILRRLGAGAASAGMLVAACAGSPFLVAATSNARNDALPLLLLLAAMWCVLRGRQHGARRWWLAAGLAAGLSVLAKLSYGFAPLVLLCCAGRRGWPACLLGCAIAAMPLLAAAAMAPAGVAYGLFAYHLTAPIAFYTQAGQAALLGWPARAAALGEWLLLGGNPGLLLAAMLAGRPRAMPAWLLAGALVCGFLPRPSWPMYYAPVAPLLACLAAGFPGRRTWRLGAVALLPALPFLALRAEAVGRLAQRDAWVGLAAHDDALAVRAALVHPGAVATLFPTLVLDANAIVPELAAGPFFFRSAGLVPPAQAARLHGVGADGLAALFAERPPAGILAGPYAAAWTPPMDAALADYAAAHAWRPVPIGGATLWVRP